MATGNTCATCIHWRDVQMNPEAADHGWGNCGRIVHDLDADHKATAVLDYDADPDVRTPLLSTRHNFGCTLWATEPD